MNSTSIFVTLKKSRKFWRSARIVKVTRARPSLKAGEVAVEIVVKTPDDFFDAPRVFAELTPIKASLPQ